MDNNYMLKILAACLTQIDENSRTRLSIAFETRLPWV
jgi:hypothetical protein